MIFILIYQSNIVCNQLYNNILHLEESQGQGKTVFD